MKAGKSKFDVGTRVQIVGLTGEDADLNGLTGKVTHPFAFGCTDEGWIGVWLDKFMNDERFGNSLNVHEDEVIQI